MHTSNVLLLVLAACGSSPGPHATPDAAVDAAVQHDAPDAAGTCRVTTDLGTVIMEMNVATAVPAPQGGSIPDGTYVLTAMAKYTGAGGATGPTGTSGSETSYLLAGHSHVVTTQGGSPQYNDYTLATSGSALTLTQTCPTTMLQTFDGFTQTGNVVTLIDSTNSLSREFSRMP